MACRWCVGVLARSIQRTLSSGAVFECRPLLTVRSPYGPVHRLPRSPTFASHGECGGAIRSYSSRSPNSSGEEEVDDEEDDDEDEDEEDDDEDEEEQEGLDSEGVARRDREKSEAEKVEEAAGIGYKVVGPLDSSEDPFKLYEPVFAVVQIGSHQFKVSNGDSIFTERLKYCEVNDKLILNRVLLLGSRSQTIIGRPIFPEAAVHAVVEEHALDAKVIVFKKKRRKNYRRTKYHQQDLTKLRITDIQGIDKSELTAVAAAA